MSQNMEANLTTLEQLDLPTDRELALTANSTTGPTARQGVDFETLRANAMREAKQAQQQGLHPAGTPQQAAEWVAHAFETLDNAVLHGFSNGLVGNGGVSANDTILDYDEHVEKSDITMEPSQRRLTAMQAVMSAGFTQDISLMRTEYLEQKAGELTNQAQISMDARAESTPDQSRKEKTGTSVPIVHVDYSVPLRQQQQSMALGESIDDQQAEDAGRTLRETEEKLYFRGWGPTVPGPDGGALNLYGATDSNIAITGSATGGFDTADNIRDTVLQIVDSLRTQTSDNDRGPSPQDVGMWLWHAPQQTTELDAVDPDGDGNLSVRRRLFNGQRADFPYVDVAEAGFLDDGELVASVKDRRFVKILTAQAPTNLSAETDMGLATDYKAMASRIPFFKKTANGVKGHVYLTGA